MPEPVFIPLAQAAEIAPDTVKVVRVHGLPVLLVHHDGQLFAVENRCSHADEPLACGRVRFGWIACPAHGARFDLATGEALSQPATDPIRTFPLRLIGDTIEVAV